MLKYQNLVPLLDAQVAIILPRQVLDRARPDCGAFINPGEGIAGSDCLSTVTSLGFAYLLKDSRHYQSREVLDRILLAAEYVRTARRPSGRVDLIVTNFDCAPTTAFVVQAIAPVVKAARKAEAEGDKGGGEMAEVLGEFIRTAAPGMASGGFHTPNHRWVLVSALSQALELFPELDVLDTIEAYLAETIDINADGEYSERSTGVYNAVCNRSLRLAAAALGRPELLEPVRRNLDFSYYLLHADGTVVTSISRRHDRGKRIVPVNLADSYYALGRQDKNGFYVTVADWLFDLSNGGLPWTLQPFVEHPEWRVDELERTPLPERYSKVYPASGLWRVRQGALSATAAAGITAPFSLHYGQAQLTAVKLSSTYFATGQFIGEDFRAQDGRVRMHHYGKNLHYKEKDYDRPVYWLPLAEKVDAANWQEVRGRRETFTLLPLEVDLEIQEVERGFDLHITTSGGLDNIPFQIECVFAPGGEFEFDSGVVQGTAGNTAFLKVGYATYRVGTDAISVGPGALAHRMWHMRNSEPSPESFRMLITLVTPVDRVLEIRCGTWSAATQSIV
ncbi:MAG: hypothetical protein KAV99_00010 [Candidatus Latescibacteria bacterium]|nr:hypothetical protein [Candidatus Latescibacterota bacterium]